MKLRLLIAAIFLISCSGCVVGYYSGPYNDRYGLYYYPDETVIYPRVHSNLRHHGKFHHRDGFRGGFHTHGGFQRQDGFHFNGNYHNRGRSSGHGRRH